MTATREGKGMRPKRSHDPVHRAAVVATDIQNLSLDEVSVEIALSICGAKTRAGAPCRNIPMKNGRCRMHGGGSTGPRTAPALLATALP